MRIAVATILGIFIGMFADWLFGGILFHAKYNAYPEVWRNFNQPRKEMRAVFLSIVISVFTFGGFAWLYTVLRIHSWENALELAVAIWVIAPLPLLIANALFVKIHPAIVVSHSLAWLTKLCIAAGVAVFLLR